MTVSSEDLQAIARQAHQTSVAINKTLMDHIRLTEASLEALEKQVATLALGYAEQAVIIESLVGQLTFGTDEERKAFQDSMNLQRQEMFNIMREGASVISDDDPGLAAALEDAIAEREADTTS